MFVFVIEHKAGMKKEREEIKVQKDSCYSAVKNVQAIITC